MGLRGSLKPSSFTLILERSLPRELAGVSYKGPWNQHLLKSVPRRVTQRDWVVARGSRGGVGEARPGLPVQRAYLRAPGV